MSHVSCYDLEPGPGVPVPRAGKVGRGIAHGGKKLTKEWKVSGRRVVDDSMGGCKGGFVPTLSGDRMENARGIPGQVHASVSSLYKDIRCHPFLHTEIIKELEQYCGRINPSPTQISSWPASVEVRWKILNRAKCRGELALLSWNTNGRLDFRGCRESLLRRWSSNGFVDVGLVQEHFKKEGVPLFDLFGPGWWNISSGAVGEARGRRSGGCAIFGQPCLVAGNGFQEKVAGYVEFILRVVFFAACISQPRILASWWITIGVCFGPL